MTTHSYDPALVLLSITVSFLSSFTGLNIGIRTRDTVGRARLWWIALSAVTLGGGAIWAMHFIAMLALHAGSMKPRYDLGLTILSLALAIAFTGLGMILVGRYGSKPRSLIAAGTAMGAGVASMHYTGMAAMTVSARVQYDPLLVAASVAIAVVASTVALWLLLNLQRTRTRLFASGVMAVAVSGMHYTGMAATRFTMDPTIGQTGPAQLSSEIMTWGVVAATVLVLLIAYAAHVLETRFSEHRELMAQLEDARTRAEAGSQAKSEFLATMSHEIRTPLNSIIGFTDLLLEDPELNAKQRRQIGLVHNSGRALLTIVNDVLDFSKIEAGKVDLEVEPFAIRALIDNVVSIVQGGAEAKGLKLAVTMGPGLEGFFAGDETRLRQVLLNLLINAIKFTSTGSVTLNASHRGSASGAELIRFEVTDTGIGVSADAQDRLFENFMQADASVTREFGGTGLGLAISKRLVELMGGEIGVVSQERSGSTFWFELGLPRSTKAPAALDAPVSSPGSHRGARILLAEDVAINQELACAILRRAGHTVDVASDGQQALEAVTREQYDLVLMDIQMPKMDGLTATRMIRELPGANGLIPIVALTANVLPEQIKGFTAAGMNGHVAKPIRQAELYAAIEKVISARVPDAVHTPEHDGGATPMFDKGAINRVVRLAPDADPPEEVEESAVAFDQETFDKIRNLLPPERLNTHLGNFDGQLRDLCEAEEPAKDVAQVAHKLVSQAGMLGFMDLSERCRELEQGSADGTPDLAVFQLVQVAARDARDKLAALLLPHKTDG